MWFLDTWFSGLVTCPVSNPNGDTSHHCLVAAGSPYIPQGNWGHWRIHHLLLAFCTTLWHGFSSGWCRTVFQVSLPRVPNGYLGTESLYVSLLLHSNLGVGRRQDGQCLWTDSSLVAGFSGPLSLPCLLLVEVEMSFLFGDIVPSTILQQSLELGCH